MNQGMLDGYGYPVPRMINIREILAEHILSQAQAAIDSRDYGIADLNLWNKIEIEFLGKSTNTGASAIATNLTYDGDTASTSNQRELIQASNSTLTASTGTGLGIMTLCTSAANMSYSFGTVEMWKKNGRVYSRSISHSRTSSTATITYIITRQGTVDTPYKYFTLTPSAGSFVAGSSIRIIGHRKIPYSGLVA